MRSFHPARVARMPLLPATMATTKGHPMRKLISASGSHHVGAPSALVGANALVGAAAALAGVQGASLNQAGPTNGRRQNLGFPSTTTTLSQTQTAQSAPQTWFRPDRTFIGSSIVGFYAVSAILIGNKEQFVNANPCPANMFSELAVNADVEYDTCEPAVTISVQVQNLDTTASHTVIPGMTGRSAY